MRLFAHETWSRNANRNGSHPIAVRTPCSIHPRSLGPCTFIEIQEFEFAMGMCATPEAYIS
jgi:hypothetical protein